MEEDKKREEGKKEKSSTVYGLYIGVITGAIVMMIAGGLGYKKVADLSLVMGICAGPTIGWLIDKFKQDKKTGR